MDLALRSMMSEGYPAPRPVSFFMNVIHLLSHPLVATELGPHGLNLIRIVVSEEDKHRCLHPAFFTDDDLRPRMRITEKTLVKARQVCIESGWLRYEPGKQGRPSRAWVTIPDWVVTQFGKPERWKNSTELKNQRSQWKNSTDLGTKVGTEAGTKDSPSYIPIPITLSSPPPPSMVWEQVEEAMLDFGIGETSKPLRSLQDRRIPIDLALGVLRHASEVMLWSPALVRRRLINLRLGQEPADRRLWPPPDLKPVAPQICPQQSALEKMRLRDARLRQLELKFESELRDLTVTAIIDRYPLSDQVRDRLRPYPTWKLIRDSGIRLAVFEAIELFKEK